MPSLPTLVQFLRRDLVRLRKAVARLSDKPKRAERAPTDRRLLSSRECDRLYRRRSGTTAAAYRAGQLPGRWTGKAHGIHRGHCGGKTLLVSAKHAEFLFGAQYRR